VKKLVVTLCFVLAACAQHGDILPPIDVAQPPVPTDFSVSTADYVTYHLSWDIVDPSSLVTEYRVYSLFPGYDPVLQGTTDTTAVEINTQVQVLGISFCVSAVTVEHVEGRLACASAE